MYLVGGLAGGVEAVLHLVPLEATGGERVFEGVLDRLHVVLGVLDSPPGACVSRGGAKTRKHENTASSTSPKHKNTKTRGY